MDLTLDLMNDTPHIPNASSFKYENPDKSDKSFGGKSKSSEKSIRRDDSVQISFSELEGIANNMKMRDDVQKERHEKSHNSRASSKSSKSSKSESVKHSKSKRKQVKRENKDSEIRREKLDLLYKISQINMVYKRNSSVSMEDTFDEIEFEFTKLSKEIHTVKGVDVCKTMLMLSIQGLEMANNRFDPIGVDLHGWSESLAYSMQNKDYDEVLAELYEKYYSDTKMMPELKLLLMLCGSAAMFAWTKRMSKPMDPNEALGKMFSGGNNKNERVSESVYTYEAQDEDSYVSSAKIEEPQDSINLTEVIKQMNTQKKKGGRPPGSKNKKKNIVLG